MSQRSASPLLLQPAAQLTSHRRWLHPWGAAAIVGVLAALVVALPLLHGLHHHLSEAPSDCPVRLLQQALVLLFVVVLLLVLRLFLGQAPGPRGGIFLPVAVGVFPGYRFAGRAPPFC